MFSSFFAVEGLPLRGSSSIDHPPSNRLQTWTLERTMSPCACRSFRRTVPKSETKTDSSRTWSLVFGTRWKKPGGPKNDRHEGPTYRRRGSNAIVWLKGPNGKSSVSSQIAHIDLVALFAHLVYVANSLTRNPYVPVVATSKKRGKNAYKNRRAADERVFNLWRPIARGYYVHANAISGNGTATTRRFNAFRPADISRDGRFLYVVLQQCRPH